MKKTTKKAQIKTPKISEEIEVHETPSNDISGFGENVLKIVDKKGNTICFLGKINREERIHFPKAISFEQMRSVYDFLSKKKVQRKIGKDISKAQKYINTHFG